MKEQRGRKACRERREIVEKLFAILPPTRRDLALPRFSRRRIPLLRRRPRRRESFSATRGHPSRGSLEGLRSDGIDDRE